MTALAEIEQRVRENSDCSVFERTHLHRAWREDALGRTRGRDRIRDRALAELAVEKRGPLTIDADGDAMIAFTTAGGWRGHRWAMREGERIFAETEVIDGVARAVAIGRDPEAEAVQIGAQLPMHAALGELRPGRGQLATPDRPDLPHGFAAVDAATYLHRLWNARALNLIPERWRGPDEAAGDGVAFLLRILTAMPDAVCLIERSTLIDGRTAVLWRLHGHHLGPGFGHPSGRRIRLIGSSLIDLAGGHVVAEDLLVDTLALRANAHRPMVDYLG